MPPLQVPPTSPLTIPREGATSTKAMVVAETRDQVVDRLLEMCGYLGSFTDACRVAVVGRAQELYTYITTEDWDSGICDLSGMCSQVPPPSLLATMPSSTGV